MSPELGEQLAKVMQGGEIAQRRLVNIDRVIANDGRDILRNRLTNVPDEMFLDEAVRVAEIRETAVTRLQTITRPKFAQVEKIDRIAQAVERGSLTEAELTRALKVYEGFQAPLQPTEQAPQVPPTAVEASAVTSLSPIMPIEPTPLQPEETPLPEVTPVTEEDTFEDLLAPLTGKERDVAEAIIKVTREGELATKEDIGSTVGIATEGISSYIAKINAKWLEKGANGTIASVPQERPEGSKGRTPVKHKVERREEAVVSEQPSVPAEEGSTSTQPVVAEAGMDEEPVLVEIEGGETVNVDELAEGLESLVAQEGAEERELVQALGEVGKDPTAFVGDVSTGTEALAQPATTEPLSREEQRGHAVEQLRSRYEANPNARLRRFIGLLVAAAKQNRTITREEIKKQTGLNGREVQGFIMSVNRSSAKDGLRIADDHDDIDRTPGPIRYWLDIVDDPQAPLDSGKKI